MTMASNRDLFGDDSDDDDDDVVVEKEDVVMEDTTNAATTAPSNMDDDDDDDDDAPQFDDQDVVGTKSTLPVDRDRISSVSLDTNKEATATATATGSSSSKTTPQVIPVNPTLVIPDIVAQFPSDVRHTETTKYFTKLPNLMGIQPTAFAPDTYDPSHEEADYQQAAFH